jgi:peptide/nickel transport system substrate-binding protein
VKTRRIGAAGAIVATTALVLSACATPQGSEIVEDTAVNVGWNQPFYSQNNLSSSGNATANANIIYLTTSTFNYYDGDLNLVPNTEFGTYEKLSDDPLTVKYTVNEGVEWSDGTPVDAADLYLYWGPQADALFNTVTADDVEFDEETGAVNAGDEVYFDGSSAAMNLILQAPEIGDDGRSVTLVYDSPRSDWEVSFQPSPMAAHAVANLALGIEDPEEGKQAIIDAFTDNDSAALAKIAESWNNDFNYTSMPDNELLYLSNGAYVMTEYVENQFLTVTANPDYNWGPAPKVESITIRYTEDPLASVTALQNGEVDLIQPQSSVDVIQTLETIDGITFQPEAEGTYEHVDVIFNNGGPFDPATYGGDEDKARAVRQAFLLSVPRSEIMEKLIVPLQPDATLRNSHTVVPGSPAYEDVVAANGSDFYTDDDEANRETAKQLLADAGVTTPIDVRFLYGASNVRRANEYQLIAGSASQVGFNVIDEGDDGWSSRLTQTDTYDASLFGWQSTNTFALNSEANYITGGVNNYAGYSNDDIDAWYQEMASADADTEKELTINIEKQLNEDGYSVSIFQFPGVVAWRNELSGVQMIPISPTIFWNYWEWEISVEDTIDAPTEEPAAEETEE